MAWRPHARVSVSSRSPRAAGVCDRCGIPTNHYKLRWQFEFQGLLLQNLRILVCNRCLDVPNPQLQAKILSPDPLPIFNARPEPFTTTGFSYQESNIMCLPSLGSSAYPGGSDFNSDLSSDLGGNASNAGLGGDGSEMTMPDGITVMLMPGNPD